jgi:hypothetical protein
MSEAYDPADVDDVDGDQADVDDVVDDDEADAPAITGQEIGVTMVNGDHFVVKVRNRDYIAWDMTAPRKKWDAQRQPFLFGTFLAYSAAKREGLFAGTFDGREDGSWINSVDDVDQRVAKRVPPTRPAAAHD